MRPTLNVNLTLSVIPCKQNLDIIDFYVVNCHLLFDFSFKLQSSMTVTLYSLIWDFFAILRQLQI
jgi:hypothetical protein